MGVVLQAAAQAERQSSNAAASTSAPALGPTPASPLGADRRLPDRMRNWSGRLGGQITSLVDNLKRSHLGEASSLPNSPAGAEQEGVGAALRGIFQRQPGNPAQRSSLDSSLAARPAAGQEAVYSPTQRPDSSSSEVISSSSAPLDPALTAQQQLVSKSAQPQHALPSQAASTAAGVAHLTPRSPGPAPASSQALRRLLRAEADQQEPRSIAAMGGGVAAIALTLAEASSSPPTEQCIYAVGHNGTLKAFALQSGNQVSIACSTIALRRYLWQALLRASWHWGERCWSALPQLLPGCHSTSSNSAHWIETAGLTVSRCCSETGTGCQVGQCASYIIGAAGERR